MMAEGKLTGVVHKIFAKEEINERFSKREFVVMFNDGKYDQHVRLETHNRGMDVLDGLGEGQEVEVRYAIRGREYEKRGELRYFNTLVAISVDVVGEAAPNDGPGW